MRFDIGPSRTYVLLLIAVHLLVIASVCLTSLPVWARVALTLAVLLNLFHHLHAGVQQSWLAFSLNQKALRVHTLSGETVAGRVLPETVVTARCVVLCASLEGSRLPVCRVIFRDAMQSDAFRELRIRLRFP